MPKSKHEEELATLIKWTGLPEPTREYAFAKPRRWRFDFAWISRRVAVECEGGHWNGGRHVSGQGFEDDAEKYNEAALLGWTVIRVTGKTIKSGQAILWIERALGVK